MPEFQARRNPAPYARIAQGGFVRFKARGSELPQECDEPQGYHNQEGGDDRAQNLLPLGAIRELTGQKPAERFAEDEGRDQQNDDDVGQIRAQPFLSAGASTGAPAFFQAPKPPATWATGFSPISCAA